MKSIEYREFISEVDKRKFTIPYAISPSVDVELEKDLPTLTPQAEKTLKEHYLALSTSSFRTKGIGIIFGTFDNLHTGHKIMLNTAKSLCDELYIGLEDQSVALKRKNFKHPIQSNAERIQALVESGITPADHIFIRNNALLDIKRLLAKRIPIHSLFVGETQKDNIEIVNAIEFCCSQNINVVAITRMKPKNKAIEISSSLIHKLKAKTKE